MRLATKDEANYRRGDLEHHCAICTMFQPPHGCHSVEGTIKPADLCDYFQRSKSDAVDGEKLRRKA
jgi:hypothetical protein